MHTAARPTAQRATRPAARRATRPAARRQIALWLAAVLLAGLYAAPAVAQSDHAITLTPVDDRKTAVRGGDEVDVDGDVPPGEITAASLVALDDGGAEVGTQTPQRLNVDASQGDYLFNDDGALRGRITMGCLFNPPASFCPHPLVTGARLDVTIGGTTTSSAVLDVDYIRPLIERADIIAPDQIVVVFSEAVRLVAPGPVSQDDSPVDWQVRNPSVRVLDVSERSGDCPDGGSGCTRVLRVETLPEDAEPDVEYDPPLNREEYVDGALNIIDRSAGRGIVQAIDNVRPPIPSIDEVAGRDTGGGDITANDETPSVTVGNVAGGYTLRAFANGAQRGQVGPLADGTSSATIELDDLGADGGYELSVVAEDANGNLSTDGGKSPSRQDGSPNPVTYVLDTIAPVIVSASRQSARTVQVHLSEPVSPAGDAGTWTVGGQDAVATGEDAQRTLTVAGDLPADDVRVSWEPDGDSTYRDAAGNELVPRTLDLVDLPALPAPVVTEPVAELYTAAASTTVAGTAPTSPATLVVELYAQGGDQALDSTAVSDGAWAFEVDLPADGRYRFEVRLRDTATGAASSRVEVPDLIRDTVDPSVDVSEPSPRLPTLDNVDTRRQYGVGGAIPVAWVAEDPATDDERPDHCASISVAILLDDEQPRTIAPDRACAPGTMERLTYTVTAEDLGGAGEREARFAVTATDLAGNAATATSAPVLLLRDLIDFAAVHVDNSPVASVVEARFAVPLAGSTNALDWTIDGLTVRSAMLSADRMTVVLVANQPITDPNAASGGTLEARYAPSLLATDRLQGEDGTRVATDPRVVSDGIPPALDVNQPASGPLNADSVTVTGQTDETSAPNTVLAFRADGAGAPRGNAIATSQAGEDGAFSLAVPLTPNAVTRFVVVAQDPAGNTTTGPVFEVIEDSIIPVVQITSPASGDVIGDEVPIRWVTTDAHPDTVTLEYRQDDGPWQLISSGEPDDGAFDWQLPDGVEDGDIIDIRVTARDRAGNVGDARSGGNLVDLLAPAFTRALATGERTVEVFFSEPVVTDPAPAGFSIVAGPGVSGVDGSGAARTLRLNADLQTTTPEVSYNGNGVRDRGGQSAPAERLVAERGFAFAVTGLAAAPTSAGSIRLSWSDDRNREEHVDHYEVSRDDQEVARVPATGRGFLDPAAGDDEVTYTVVTVDDLGNRSRPATVTIDPLAPNITPAGGFAISDDGDVALIVPPGAVDRDYFGTLELDVAPSTPGYTAVTGGYDLVTEAADGGAPLDAFDRYSCVSFRVGSARMDTTTRERDAVLRTDGSGTTELATRVGRSAADACFLTPAQFVLGEAAGVSVRVFGPDPAIAADRFATAAGLSQSSFAAAGVAVIARSDDYPDALAASALAAQVGGPVLLAEPGRLPLATQLELLRLGAEEAVLVGGNVALGPEVEQGLRDLGLATRRVEGPTRFHTAAAIAEHVGAFDDRVFVATGENFADALAASGGSAHLTRPILLVQETALPAPTLATLQGLGVSQVDLVGGPNAVSTAVEDQLRAAGFTVTRIGGNDRFATAVALAQALEAEGLDFRRPVAASGDGDGRTSPDALAAGPVAGRASTALLLVPRTQLHPAVADAIGDAEELAGVVIAGGPVAVSDTVRGQIDSAAN